MFDQHGDSGGWALAQEGVHLDFDQQPVVDEAGDFDTGGGGIDPSERFTVGARESLEQSSNNAKLAGRSQRRK